MPKELKGINWLCYSIMSPNISGIYLKRRNPHPYKLYVRPMEGKTHPQNSLITLSTSILGT